MLSIGFNVLNIAPSEYVCEARHKHMANAIDRDTPTMFSVIIDVQFVYIDEMAYCRQKS